ALALFADRSQVRRVLDLGTGTGCLLLAALSEFPDAFGVGVDVVEDGTRLAAENARRIGLAERAAFLVADWAAPLTGRFDLVLSNPPYIPGADIDRALESKPGESKQGALEPEVARFEPRTALDGGPDGLAAYRRIIALAAALLSAGGALIVELGIGQFDAVSALAAGCGLTTSVKQDLAGIPRAAVLRRDLTQKRFGRAWRGD